MIHGLNPAHWHEVTSVTPSCIATCLTPRPQAGRLRRINSQAQGYLDPPINLIRVIDDHVIDSLPNIGYMAIEEEV